LILPIGTVTALYDFHKKIIPGEDSIKRNLPLVNFNDLTVDRKKSMVFLRKKGMLIDTGGITKGYAADKSVEVLRFDNLGPCRCCGDIRTFGLNPMGDPEDRIRNPGQRTGR
jgi:thiamine biosynthesis lipoprotein